jgi:predicted RND superfamily exporter protein
MTTAIGFGVFYFTNSSLLVEFGVVSALNVMVTYVLCLVLVPISVYYMGLPQVKHLKHLDGKWAKKFLSWIDHTVHNHRPAIYLTALVVVLVSAYGVTKINVIGYVVDDLPKKILFMQIYAFSKKTSMVFCLSKLW